MSDKLFDEANISYTTFIRTTDQKHKETVKFFWKKLVDNGYIYKGNHEGWYSISDETFYSSSQIQEIQNNNSGNCAKVAIETGNPVEWAEEENYKFRLSNLKNKLIEWLDTNPEVIVPSNKYNETKSLIMTDLIDLSISRPRSRLNWGISVPDDVEQTIYVWLDALINYLTITGYPWNQNEKDEKIINAWPADIHIIGKDILRFHAIFWPSFLLAVNLPLPKKILTHSHWTMGKHKMSKSRGNVVDPFMLLDRYGVDAIRYYLMRDGGISDDGSYSESNLHTRYRKELAGQLGNLVSRSTSVSLNPTSLVPTFPLDIKEKDVNLTNSLKNLPGLVGNHFENFEFNKGLICIFEAISEVNKLFQSYEPWNLVDSLDSSPQNRELLNRTLFFAAETARISGILLQPIMPTKMSTLLDNLSIGKDERKWSDAVMGNGWPSVKNGSEMMFKIKNKDVLFPKLKQ
ncbi:1313_t:CDS:2 [Diversispora eburnea]|uniref:Probable methionine--tRNA ligase, mitochondrial n=1 Tax=Diversispora eburnea TaxID=1213867 RepID=A0A9N8V9F7_9GLOM|nr:1313_t:CDS:2 [Diversispora eburnea]